MDMLRTSYTHIQNLYPRSYHMISWYVIYLYIHVYIYIHNHIYILSSVQHQWSHCDLQQTCKLVELRFVFSEFQIYIYIFNIHVISCCLHVTSKVSWPVSCLRSVRIYGTVNPQVQVPNAETSETRNPKVRRCLTKSTWNPDVWW